MQCVLEILYTSLNSSFALLNAKPRPLYPGKESRYQMYSSQG
jgi:hypothetical protein